MEAAVRNCVKEKCLNVACGAFSERWHDITVQNGKKAELLPYEWGKAANARDIEKRLEGGGFDAVTVVHNETSTGVMNPLEEIAEAVKKFPSVSLLVDAVSSMGGVKIEVDRLGIDVCLASAQKALGLPPGLPLQR
jgi:aspartate aminotransferase-like enzyme